MSRGVKEIKKRLNAIANTHNRFGFKPGCQPIHRRREETYQTVPCLSHYPKNDFAEIKVQTLYGWPFLRIDTIRAYLRAGQRMQPLAGAFLAKWIYLRALNLSDLRLKNLLNAIGNLLHLRYLDLSRNRDLKALPSLVAKQHNLLTLKLQRCGALEELPKNFEQIA
ncbi:hypothetical protein Cgig2_026401 [Carnegiea gigantea]|uniref:Uncharacterized protein n=1 Tax=Carnegiea gigantea TaxID=171969 RepID=A0A9Q1K2G9_9CARY|nr:hypothetical protein Cgig2_026401 [Carnegiea gigantea]